MKTLSVLLALALAGSSASLPAKGLHVDQHNVRMIYCGDYLGTAFVVDKNLLATARHLTHGRVCTDAQTGVRLTMSSEDDKHDFSLVSMDTGDIKPLSWSCKRFHTGSMYNSFGYGHGEWSHTVMVATKNHSDDDLDVGDTFVPGMRVLIGDLISGMFGGPVVDKDNVVHGINNVSGGALAFSFELADTSLCRRK